ncbi:hypothetical protein FRC12_004866 [Ceratobasidium sp. 428]|nr:hypothetical protein FRC12_004866 [Ceratobasidium sp. 428]
MITRLGVKPYLRVRLCGNCCVLEVECYPELHDYHLKPFVSRDACSPYAEVLPTEKQPTPARYYLRRDMKRVREAYSRLEKSGDHLALKQWEKDMREEVRVHDEFGELLQRHLIYPELTPRQKKEMELLDRVEVRALEITSS